MEERERYCTATDTTTTLWTDLRFEDGKHTGVRVLRGTGVIEVQRDGRKRIFDLAECLPIDLTIKSVYNG